MFVGRILRALAGTIVAAALGGGAVRGDVPPQRMYQKVDVGPGIVAFIAAETSGPIPSGNVVAIVGDEGVLVVDSGRFPTLARRMIADIRKMTDKPVKYLVHSHWHLDHIVGDDEFRKAFPGVTVVTTDFTRKKLLEKQPGYLKDIEKNDRGYLEQIQSALAKGKRDDGTPIPEESLKYLRGEVADIELEIAELAGVPVIEPGLTFEKALTISLGQREVKVLFLGAGNTAGDTVAWVPDARVIATGDLLVAPVPYGYGCHPADWITTLQKLMTFDAAAIVPGHGGVMHDWSYAKQVVAVLEAVRAQVAEAVRAGATLDQTRERVNLDSYKKAFAGDDYARGRAFRDFFAADAVARAYQEAKGQVAEE